MKRLFLTMTATIVSVVCSAFVVKNSDGVSINYQEVWKDGVTIVQVASISNGKYSGSVVIPEEVYYIGKRYKVTSIADNAFKECYDLTSVSIPNTVTNIGEYAFYGCSKLSSVDIPNSVTDIGNYAFNNCYNLKSVNIPENVTVINTAVFSGCKSLTSITIPGKVTYIGTAAFSRCDKLNVIYCLNTTPPDFEMSNVFWVDLGHNQDTYVIYNYVPLHVPKGCGDLYAAAYEWRYFKKIIEDIDLEETGQFVNVSIKQGEVGYTRQLLKKGESFRIYIGTLGDYKINAVTFNGKDVTTELDNGYFNTPGITEDSELSISYEIESTDIRNISSLDNLKVTGYNGEITISNIDTPSTVSVYNIEGKLIENTPSAIGSINISVPSEGVYIVKVESRSYKIAL